VRIHDPLHQRRLFFDQLLRDDEANLLLVWHAWRQQI
jgi:hypothetical protein